MKFLELEPDTFGMDFSDLRLRVAKLNKKGEFFDLVSWNEIEIPEGIIIEGEIKDEDKLVAIIKKTIDGAKGRRITAKNVVASLPEKKAFLQVIEVPRMDEEELKTAIPFEAENYIPLSIDQVYLDYSVVPISNNGRNKMEILIGGMPKTVIDPYVSCIKKAGLVPTVLEVESQSITRALIKNGVSPFPTLIIDFGKSTTSFIVFAGHSLRFTSSITMSSQELTEAISKELKIDLAEAEKLKTKNGIEDKKITKAMAPLLVELVKQTQRYIEYYHSHNNEPIKKILLCGKGSNLKGLSEFLFNELKIPTELANPWVNISPANKVPKIPFKDSLGYTTVLGLALRIYDKSTTRKK